MIRLLCLPWTAVAWLVPLAVGDVFDNVYARRMLADLDETLPAGGAA